MTLWVCVAVIIIGLCFATKEFVRAINKPLDEAPFPLKVKLVLFGVDCCNHIAPLPVYGDGPSPISIIELPSPILTNL